MLHWEKAVLSSCILCGMLAVYCISVYVTVSVIIALPLVLYLASKVNRSRIHVRGITSPSAFQKLLIYFHSWSHTALIWAMKTCQQLRPAPKINRISEVSACAEESNLTLMEPSQGNNTNRNDSGLYGEKFQSNRRISSSPYTSGDSIYSSTRIYSRSQQSFHRTPSQNVGDSSFPARDSPWGKSVSPKLRSHGGGVKTVQTVAGPLLASTRFNISNNIRTFGDVSSPGLSRRVTRYAEDSKMLTHQKQYSGPGQFPLIQLDHSASRLPILSYHKFRRSDHIPVTVRIAPPHSSDARLLGRSQILAESSVEDQHSSKSVLDVLKEMSRKRIYAQIDESEDDDVIKRQRVGEGHIVEDHGSDSQPVQDDIVAVGKRARVESHSQTETNGQPLQHQEKRIRSNEIFSSLSSSRNLLNHKKASMKRKSSIADGSRSGTPVMGKPPKQSRDNIEDAANVIQKKATATLPTTSSLHIPTTSANTEAPAIHHTEEKATDKCEVVPPSEFLPKFAAVLDKSTPPVLNSVAALEAKRAYDRQTRLRSMLAVIAGEDDFVMKPSSSKNDIIASTTATTTTLQTICPLGPVSAEVKEKTSAAETSVPSGAQVQQPTDSIQTAADKSSDISTSTSPTMSNSITAMVPNTSVTNTLSESVPSLINQATTSSSTLKLSSPTIVSLSSEHKMPVLMPTSVSNNVAPTEDKIDPFKNSVVTSNNPFLSGKPQPSHSAPNSSITASDSLFKILGDSTPQSFISHTLDSVANGSNTPSAKEQTIHGSLSDVSSTSGGFSASSTSTVISVVKPVVPEITTGLFSFGKTAAPHAVNAGNSTSTAITSNSMFGSTFSAGNTQASADPFGSPSIIASDSNPAAVCAYGIVKSDDKPTASLPSATLNCNINSAAGIGSIFQSSAVTSSTTTISPGGFSFNFSKEVKADAAASTVGGFQPTVNIPASNVETNVATSAITCVTTAVTSTALASTSKSTSPSFRTSPVFTFSNSNTVREPSSGGFTGGIFGNTQSQNDRVTQKAQQNLFTFGSSCTSDRKSGGFSFTGSSSSANQHSNEMFGSGGSKLGQVPQAGGENLPDQSSQPVFGGSGNRADQPQPSSEIFGTLQSSGGVFGTAQPSQPAGGLFGNSVAQAGGIFGSSNSNSGQVQLTGGIFGTGTDLPSQSLLPSSGVFGSSGNQVTQPSGGIFGSSGNVTTPSTQPSGGIFGSSGIVSTPSTQPSGGIFGSSGNVSTQSAQLSGGIFGSSGIVSTPSTQQSVGLFGSSGSVSTPSTQQSVGLFGSSGSVSAPSTQPSGGLFGSGGSVSTPSTQPSGGLFGSGGSVSTPSTQPSGGLFGSGGSVSTPSTQSSGGLFASNENISSPSIQSSAGLFVSSGNASTPSTQPSVGLFGSSGNVSTSSVQPSGGLFGNSGNVSTPSSQPSAGLFGNSGNVSTPSTQPSAGLFGNSGSVSTPSTQASVGLFGSSGTVSTQASGGIFGSSGSVSVQSSHSAANLFGGIEGISQQTSQTPGGMFGTSSQPSGGIFCSGTPLPTQPAAGVFGGSGSAQPVFQFGSTLPSTPAQQPTASGNTGLFGASTPFQFGAGSSTASTSASQPAGGFSFGSPSAPTINFTAGTSGSSNAFQFGAGAAPVYGNQTTGQGMFSIGSGSTAPRSRTNRLRRQR